MNILFIGDIVGRPGRRMIEHFLPDIKKEYAIDFVIANGENSAGGNGITIKKVEEMAPSGIDVFTTGNHTWADKDTPLMLEKDPTIPLLRAANFPPGNAGKGVYFWKIPQGDHAGKYIAVVNIIGQSFMKYHFDCPFRKMDEILETELNRDDIYATFVDFHAETTAEKYAMKYYLDGRVTSIFGTHTHITTKDLHITKNGTSFISDVGMTGPIESVIGMKVENILERFLKQKATPFQVATGQAMLNAVLVKVEDKKAVEVDYVQRKEETE